LLLLLLLEGKPDDSNRTVGWDGIAIPGCDCAPQDSSL
jgi:hypothetical protein